MFGSLGVIRPGDIQNGQVDADYALNLISAYSEKARNLYSLIGVGFLLTIICRPSPIKKTKKDITN